MQCIKNNVLLSLYQVDVTKKRSQKPVMRVLQSRINGNTNHCFVIVHLFPNQLWLIFGCVVHNIRCIYTQCCVHQQNAHTDGGLVSTVCAIDTVWSPVPHTNSAYVHMWGTIEWNRTGNMFIYIL